MSRVATALAHDPPGVAARQSTVTQAGVKMLGGSNPGHSSKRKAYSPAAFVEPQHVAQLQLVREVPIGTYLPGQASARSAARGSRRPMWLLATAGVAALLLFTLARGATRPEDARYVSKFVLAGYTASAAEVPAPDIDTTSPAQKAAALPVSPPAQSSEGYDVTGAPTISVQQIEQVLSKYGSPASGAGQALYDLGLKYGINPAFALAFFVHESGCGTKGVARFTHSLGNIRWSSGYDNYEGYRSYASWEAGMEDWYKLISDLYISGWGLRTVDQIIPVYAPYGDNNDPPSYVSSIKLMVDTWRGK